MCRLALRRRQPLHLCPQSTLAKYILKENHWKLKNSVPSRVGKVAANSTALTCDPAPSPIDQSCRKEEPAAA